MEDTVGDGVGEDDDDDVGGESMVKSSRDGDGAGEDGDHDVGGESMVKIFRDGAGFSGRSIRPITDSNL